ncbi:uncharacterized protein LOC134295082 [Anolis carolinensis]|uniref:uncharacterized protein LOC134295082 n=1 Tax=Anolis carolinensis TaxID=28377 RepID=UPI002F2B362B
MGQRTLHVLRGMVGREINDCNIITIIRNGSTHSARAQRHGWKGMFTLLLALYFYIIFILLLIIIMMIIPFAGHGSVPGGQLLFVLSGQARKERVLTAELHLFKLRPLDGPHPRRHHVQQVSVYQVEGRSRKKLLCSRLLSLLGSGWEVFSVTQAVRDWTSEEVDMGLAVAIEGGSLDADPTPGVRFASGRDHHPGRKPMLVLFAQDDSPTAPLPNTDPSGE